MKPNKFIFRLLMAGAGITSAMAQTLRGDHVLSEDSAGTMPTGTIAAGATPGEIIGRVGIAPKLGQELPLETSFVDADGKTIELGDCFQSGRPVILHLVYYECPMLCKLSSDGLLSTLSTLSLTQGEDFSIVTLSFDPREGPELSARARKLATQRVGREAVENGWRFLTGEEESIAAVTQAAGFRYTWDEASRQYAHAAGIFVLTPDGKISRYLGGIDYSPRDLRLAIVEASAGKVGTFGDQVKLLCYMYDPTVGKYGFAIMSLIRFAGLATVGGLATAIVVMVRRERQRNVDPNTRSTAKDAADAK
jgi:protein SCO1/2